MAKRLDEMMNEERPAAERLLVEPDYDREGFVDYAFAGRTYRLWYGIIGRSGLAPALVLHGGPGGNHHNLVAFQGLAGERPVIFYDQLGCGNSDRPADPSLWRAERYFNEVRSVQDGLGLKKYHLIGHSWGTTLAVGFAARHPDGILSVSLHSPILSFPRYIERVAPALKRALRGANGKAGRIIDDFELRGRGEKSAYDEACLEFVRRNVTHTWPLPEAMRKLIAARNPAVHEVMVAGESELNVLGNLRTVDVTANLSELRVPVLVTCGSDDLCTPAFSRWQAGFAADSRFYVIFGGAHMTPVDRPRELLDMQEAFLREVEGGSERPGQMENNDS